ncbi:MAG: acyl-CoA/acyl-ACP dehydrogenase [Desulfatibacillum sp.]|nr:acyl-CoA/acyl-ACP dehydrogenase [Desulfatibacillum sp.]
MSIPKEYFEVVRETGKFAKREFGEHALDWDLNPDPSHITSLWIKSLGLDLPVLTIPEEFSGVGYGPVCQALVVDAMASRCPGVASVFVHHFAGLFPVQFANKDQQTELWGAATGKAGRGIAGVVFDHDGALSIKPSGNGFILNGTSSLTANAQYADWASVFTSDQKGNPICFVVDNRSPGVSLGPNPELPGLKINPFHSLVFKDVAVPAHAILCNPEKSAQLMEQTRDLLHVLTAATALGAARTAYEKALAYARERYQFGKMIIEHQEIRRMIGAMRMKLDAATANLYEYFEENPGPLSRADRKASLVKAFCTDAAFDIIVDAIQVHGGYGYMHEQGLEKLMRDAKVLQVLGGSNPQLLVEAME